MGKSKKKYFNVTAIVTVLVILLAHSSESSPFDRHCHQPSVTALIVSIVDSAPPEPRKHETITTFAIQSSQATITAQVPHSNATNDLPMDSISSGVTTRDMTDPPAALPAEEAPPPHGPILSETPEVEPTTLLKSIASAIVPKRAILGGTSLVMTPRYLPFSHDETGDVTINYVQVAVVSLAITLFVILLSLSICSAVIVRRCPRTHQDD